VREPKDGEISKAPKWSATTRRILSIAKSKGSVSRSELVKLTKRKEKRKKYEDARRGDLLGADRASTW